MVQLSLQELKSVLKLLKDKKRKKRKNKGIKRRRITTADGYNVGGLKSDSSHMQGYSQVLPFSNTSNQQTEIMALQKNLLENQIKHPERFNKPEVPNNLITYDDFKKTMNLFGSQLGSYYDNRIGLLEDKANQFASDLNYGKSDLIKNSRNSAYIEQLPDDEEEDIKPFKFSYDDGIDVTVTGGSDFFNTVGNKSPYAEDDVNVREYTQSPMHQESLSEKKTLKLEPQTPYFENTDVYPSKTPSIYFNQSGKAETIEGDAGTPKKSKTIIEKGIKGIAKYFTPNEKGDVTPVPPPSSLQSKFSTGTKHTLGVAQMEHLDTEWYKQNIFNVIPIENSDGFPKGEEGTNRLKNLLSNVGVSDIEINHYLGLDVTDKNERKKRSSYTQRSQLYKAIYAKVRANNNKILKKQTKEK